MQTEGTILDDLAKAKAEINAKANGRSVETPEQGSEEEPAKEAASQETTEEETPTQAEPEKEELIEIYGQTFKTQKEAIAYAEKLAQENALVSAHASGVQEALNALGKPKEQQAAPQEDDFETQFYTNPKETITKAMQKAKDEALAEVRRQAHEESLWNKFLSDNPDISRDDAQMILNRDWDVIKHLDEKTAMKMVASKTRSYYQDIVDRMKPRTELPNKGGQVVSAGSGSAGKSVTPKESAKPTSFAEEIKKMRAQR